MAFTASDVKALREKTGVGMVDCKKALVESDGDMDKAIDFSEKRPCRSYQEGKQNCCRGRSYGLHR